jgi:tRNA (guanine-N7-)-methyltransferase
MTIMTDHPDRNRRKLYGRRKGPKLSGRQAALRRTLLSELAYDLTKGPLEQFPNSVRASPMREAQMGEGPVAGLGASEGGMGPIKEIWLEIGFGAGEHLVWQAREHPEIGLIGAEPYEMGMAKTLTKLEESPLNTVRLFEGDGRDVIEALPDQSLGRFFLLFPDPWPKTRHHKRRFLQMEMLDSLARVLKPGAELRFATDDKSYLPYALERLMAHPAFDWLAHGPADWKFRPADWPPTRYETKAIKGPPTFLRFVRRSLSGAVRDKKAS